MQDGVTQGLCLPGQYLAADGSCYSCPPPCSACVMRCQGGLVCLDNERPSPSPQPPSPKRPSPALPSSLYDQTCPDATDSTVCRVPCSIALAWRYDGAAERRQCPSGTYIQNWRIQSSGHNMGGTGLIVAGLSARCSDGTVLPLVTNSAGAVNSSLVFLSSSLAVLPHVSQQA